MNGTFYRGEIYYIYPGECETGSEIRSGRPGIIVSNDTSNRYSPYVEIAYLTTREKKPLLTHVHVESSGASATALCEQVYTVDKVRLGSYMGSLTKREMSDVNDAILISLGLEDLTHSRKHDLSDCGKTDQEEKYIAVCAQRDAYKEICMELISGREHINEQLKG